MAFRIPMMRFEATSRCQYDCGMCAHGAMRAEHKDFSMSLAQVERFIEATRKSDYVIGDLRIHGIGEPLLWEAFNEAVPLLAHSGRVERIFVATNGLLAHKIPDAVWDCIDEMRISVYGKAGGSAALARVAERFPDKVALLRADRFIALPKGPDDVRPTPCRCRCEGPMLFGDHVILYCGPPVFGAARSMGIDLMHDAALCVPVSEGYMRTFDPARIGALPYCGHCWANEHFDDPVEQDLTGGGWA